MKYKKIISLLAVLAFFFTLTGCSAKLEDFEEQVKKFDNIIDEETALNDMKDTTNRMLEKIYAELKDAISECKLDDDDCEVSKKAFSEKYTFEAEIDGEGE